MISANKGEWSEVYVLFKLLLDKKIQIGDINLNKIQDVYYPILKILKSEQKSHLEFSYSGDLVVIKNSQQVLKISLAEFAEKAKILLKELQSEQKSSFCLPQIEEFINSYNSYSVKGKSSDKTDIKIVIHDSLTNWTPELGFSIKSKLGGSASLLNASGATNFIYKISDIDLNTRQIEELNAIQSRSKIKDRLEYLKSKGAQLNLYGMENDTFQNNLSLIDSRLAEIVSEILLTFYTTKLNKLTDLVEEINNKNSLGYDLSQGHIFYEYKIKRFLTDIALGMMPAKKWDGQLEANGGYLVLKEDGELICYHIYNKNEFESYLFSNTKLETPSSKRHNFGSVYQKGDEFFIKLNLQIRFI